MTDGLKIEMNLSARTLVRGAKVVALVGFLLPWLLVSCSGQVMVRASGLALALGSADVRNPMTGEITHQTGSPNLLLLVSLLCVAAGLAVTFQTPIHSALRRAAWMAVAAILTGLIGLGTTVSELQKTIDHGAGAGLVTMQVENGFRMTILTLVAAAVVGFWSTRSRQGHAPDELSSKAHSVG